ncbi:MAG: Zn-dependent oxidoreductase, partial [Gluconacetobacter diazotrophicus]|nr:Zn-dependent oxidoreductase [Gluconacetobacter diazotrophicus]
MAAVVLTEARSVEAAEIPVPTGLAPEHVAVRMAACALNPGDRFFIPFGAPGVWGASGAGTVTAVGAAVPRDLLGRTVAV